MDHNHLCYHLRRWLSGELITGIERKIFLKLDVKDALSWLYFNICPVLRMLKGKRWTFQNKKGLPKKKFNFYRVYNNTPDSHQLRNNFLVPLPLLSSYSQGTFINSLINKSNWHSPELLLIISWHKEPPTRSTPPSIQIRSAGDRNKSQLPVQRREAELQRPQVHSPRQAHRTWNRQGSSHLPHRLFPQIVPPA